MLEAKAVNFAYQRGLPVLNDIACTIGDGEFIALLGHNGSGKTTLSRLFMALLHPRSGQAIDAATQAGASHAFVSGSGPSVVAFAADEAAAQRIIEVWRDTAVVDRIIRAKSPEHPNISVRQ